MPMFEVFDGVSADFPAISQSQNEGDVIIDEFGGVVVEALAEVHVGFWVEHGCSSIGAAVIAESAALFLTTSDFEEAGLTI